MVKVFAGTPVLAALQCPTIYTYPVGRLFKGYRFLRTK